MKKISLLIIIALLINMIIPLGVIASEKTTNISLNGELIKFNDTTGHPFVDSNQRTQVPFRVTLETFGAKVDWDSDTRTALAEKGGVIVEVPIGEKYILKNGEKIENDTLALIKNGKTYLPIRKVMEAFGCEVDWNGEKRIVDVKSKKYKEDLEFLEEKIIFENDIRTFTLYAFLNFTGYDDENNREGYHKVRKMVREDLNNMDLELMDNNFYKNKGIEYYYYSNTLKKLGGPPNFEPLEELADHNVKGLDRYLKEFYEKANIEKLYEEYKPYYDEELNPYRDEVYKYILKTNDYLRIDIPDEEGFYVEVNLLDAYWRGKGLGNIDLYKGMGTITTGPSDEPNIINIVHEYLHGVINPILNNYRSETKDLEDDIYYKNSLAYKQGYKNVESIIAESFVRALSRMMIDEYNNDYSIQSQVNDGFVMTKHVYDSFKNYYQNYDGSLEDFIKIVLLSYNSESETIEYLIENTTSTAR